MTQEYIGSYRILEKKGEGGMAQVYLAVHQDVPNLKVILKVLTDARLAERFKQEADKLALLDGHANICRIKHFFSHGDAIVIAMEYIDGLTLEDKIEAQGKLEIGEAVQIAYDVLDILDFAHQKDIYHRDIKPGNIMIDRSGLTKVIDFGIAKGKTDPNLTIAGTACGTPTYMAPEQFNPTEQADYALWDVYAVGTTLYKMLTGTVPFPDENPFAIRDKKLFDDPPPPRTVNSDIPKALETVILKALARDPQQRYATAQQMRDDLLPFMTQPPRGPQTPPGGITMEIPPAGQPRSKKPLLFVAGGVVLLALLAVTYLFVLQDKPTTEVEPPADHEVRTGDTSGSADTVVPVLGLIKVMVDPSGDVYLDDSLVKGGARAWMARIDTGVHTVRVENKKATQKVLSRSFNLLADSTQELEFDFKIEKPKPPPPQIRTYKVAIGSEYRARGKVFIDGVAQTRPAPATYNIREGKRSIRFEFEDNSGKTVVLDTSVSIVSDTRITFPKRAEQ